MFRTPNQKTHATNTNMQFILGADVFYSSEHFDAVLATAYLFLSTAAQMPPSEFCETPHDAAFSGEGVSGTRSSFLQGARGQPNDGVRSSIGSGHDSGTNTNKASVNCGDKGTSSMDNMTLVGNGDAGTPSSVGNSGVFSGARTSSSTGVAIGCNSGSSNDQCVFLTAYHERSARRSLRPLLRKWGLAARVLPDAPSRVLPCSLWEDGKYDSVALLEIRLA